MGRGRETRFELVAADHDARSLSVVRVTGEEALSAAFRFDVEVVLPSGGSIDLAAVIGKPATLTMQRPEAARRDVHGIILAAEMTTVSAGVPTYRFRIGPRLARLSRRVRSRIFQGESAVEIVTQVLDEAGVKHRSALSGNPPKREYTVQYRESDLAFVQRLLEWEGIAYRFDHSGGAEEVVLCDAPSAWVAMPGENRVPYRAPTEAADEEHLSALVRSIEVTAGVAVVRDFHFEKPRLDLTANARTKAGSEIETYEYPSGHHDAGGGRRLSQLRLEAQSIESETFSGSGTVLRLEPGVKFEVAGHPDPSLDRELVVQRVHHDGRQAEQAGGAGAVTRTYVNQFDALPAQASYRPPRRTARPRIIGLHTATVVGPVGEEIHTDEHGRIKVQFHWDREGRRNEHSSCWIRVGQPLAGPGWGALRLPRVGQEVVVRFLEGDADQPLVAGAVYNGANTPPLALPGQKTQSTLKSDSSPGSGGWNEIRFEDASGEEEIHLHAQRDEAIEVENDKVQRVGGAESLLVDKDRTQEVRARHDLLVVKQEVAQVAANESLSVEGARRVDVGGNHEEDVGATQSITVAGDRYVAVAAAAATSVLGAAATTIGGAYAVNVGAALNIAVGGLRSVEVGGAFFEAVGAERDEQVRGARESTTGGNEQEQVEGELSMRSDGELSWNVDGQVLVHVPGAMAGHFKTAELDGESSLAIEVGGKRMLSIDSSGTVEISASKVSFSAGGHLGLKGSSIKVIPGEPAREAQRQQLKLERLLAEKAHVDISLTDQDGNPVPNEWYRVEFPDGTVVRGATDAEGRARVPGPKEGTCKVTFPRLDGSTWEKKS